jgi:hypothetical protein
MIEVHKLHKLRIFYPSQWEGLTPEGEIINIRYRYGELTVWIDGKDGEWREIFMEQTGEPYGFEMETGHMKSLLSSVCRFLDGVEGNG